MGSRIDRLHALGQSVWLDFIRRGHLQSGEFDQLVREHGVVGVTSNPTIFQQAIGESTDYDAAIEHGIQQGLDAPRLFDALTIEDIQMACDLLKPVFEKSGGLDGRVSIEIEPRLANDTDKSIAEGLRLHRTVARPNVMVKVPATLAGLPVITRLTTEGVCVNITLIFSIARYEQVMDAWMQGLEARAAADQPLESIRSVASFFVSRVDSKVDAAIDDAAKALPAGDPRRTELESFRGRAAIANARLAYERFERTFAEPRFGALRSRGAHVQRPLWASTSTKNPAYPDTMYIDELIGPHTVNTMPPKTLLAYDDHGATEVSIRRDLDGARRLFKRLPELGIPLEAKIAELEPEGVAAFTKSYEALLSTLESKLKQLAGGR